MLDPLVKGTDPQIRTRVKMSRIPNTDEYDTVGSVSLMGLQIPPTSTYYLPRKIHSYDVPPPPSNGQCVTAAAAAVPLTSGSGSGRTKNIWIRRSGSATLSVGFCMFDFFDARKQVQ